MPGPSSLVLPGNRRGVFAADHRLFRNREYGTTANWPVNIARPANRWRPVEVLHPINWTSELPSLALQLRYQTDGQGHPSLWPVYDLRHKKIQFAAGPVARNIVKEVDPLPHRFSVEKLAKQLG